VIDTSVKEEHPTKAVPPIDMYFDDNSAEYKLVQDWKQLSTKITLSAIILKKSFLSAEVRERKISFRQIRFPNPAKSFFFFFILFVGYFFIFFRDGVITAL